MVFSLKNQKKSAAGSLEWALGGFAPGWTLDMDGGFGIMRFREKKEDFMSNTILQYLIVCPLVALAGFVDAIAGGGGLISLPAYLIAGLPTQAALATNKMSACMGSTIATGKYALNGYIPWRTAVPCVVFAMLGSSLGAKLALMLDDAVFKRLILVILPLTAIYIYRSKAIIQEKEPLPLWQTMVIGSGVAFVIGIYDGFYGPGTGVFLILLLTGLAHYGLKEANGLCKAINWTTNVSSLAVFLMNGKVLFPLGLTAGVFSIVGSYLGAKTFEKKGARSVKPLMLVVVAIFFVKVLLEILA